MGKWRNQVRKAHTAVVMKVWEAKTKLAGSSGMVLGLQGAVSASLIGLVLFLGYVYLQKRADGKEKGFPLCPFLCFGAAVIYCLQTGGWMR